jgi:3-deoxy-manno-octulosonate cytidylyltransferase (CMP-KDO synthetase)
MVAWVYERLRGSDLLDRLTVATDSHQILGYCAGQGIPALETSPQHNSGTSRLIEVMEHESSRGLRADIYVNIQGDEPMIKAQHIEFVLRPLLGRTCGAHRRSRAQMPAGPELHVPRQEPDELHVSTLRVAIDPEAATDPNVVKVVTDSHDRALYFSRLRIPYGLGGAGRARYYKHLGIYAYTAQALQRFGTLPPSPLEQAEQLEQLRFLENGIPVTVIETTEDTVGVDTEEDLRRVEEYFRRAGIAPPM